MFKLKPILYVSAVIGILISQQAVSGAKIQIDEDRWVSIGAGMRAQYTSAEDSAPNGTDRSNQFNITSVRLYLAGQVHKNVKMTFNSFCESCVFGPDAFDSVAGDGEPDSAGDWEILDAIAQFEFSPQFNIWAGRMLTPADRIEMNGPYYALSWNQYNVALLPSDGLGGAGLLGRDDGVTVWGGFDKFEYAVGIFDGIDGSAGGANDEDNVMFASRFEYNFLNKEPAPAYYTSSTYFGGSGDIFTVGFSWTHQDDFNGTPSAYGDFDGYIGDFLFEKVLSGGSVVNLEGEYKTFDNDGAAADVDSYFITVGYMFPQKFGIGTFQPYLRYVNNETDTFGTSAGFDSDMLELGLNYRIAGYDAWLNCNYTSGDALVGGGKGPDIDAITLGVQIQI